MKGGKESISGATPKMDRAEKRKYSCLSFCPQSSERQRTNKEGSETNTTKIIWLRI